MKSYVTQVVCAITLSSVSSMANALLIDRGAGMIYDTALNITWLQDMNYAQTTGYSTTQSDYHGMGSNSATGAMTWNQAQDWASNLNYGGISGWRLPSANLVGTPFGSNDGSYDGSTDASYNNTRSALGHLFYVDLNNVGYFDVVGNVLSPYGLTNTSFVDAVTGESKSFLNMQNAAYWENEELAALPAAAWNYDLFFGTQSHCCWKSQLYYAVAVHDGDVSPVPLPGTVWLFGAGLAALGFARRKKSA